MKTIYYILAIVFLGTLAACDIINPSEDIPAYLYVEPFQLETDTRTEGSNSSKIEEAWLSVNGNFLGAYTLPALIPVLGTGTQTITLSAGIKDNGISATPEIYPFYEPFETEIELRPNEVDTLRPVIGYLEDTRFAFIEDFEQGTHIFRDLRAGMDFNRIQITNENAFEGNSALVRLNEDNPLVELATINAYRDLTTQGFVAYLEVNFRSDVIVVFGVQGIDENGIAAAPVFDPGFLPSSTWNKIYFNITPLVFGNDFIEYKILFQAILPNENGVFTQNEANIWLDNVKLVHF